MEYTFNFSLYIYFNIRLKKKNSEGFFLILINNY